MKKIKFDIIEFIKTTVIFILTFSMLSVAGIYMNERQNAGQPSEVPLEKRRILENGGITPSTIQINPNHINPLQIIVTSDSKSVTAVYDSKLVSDIYKDFRDIILALFNSSAECILIDGRDEAAEFWERCLDNPDSVYIRYAGDYVYPIIYTFLEQGETAENYESAGNKTMAEVRELFILPAPETEAKFYGAAKDSSGNISVFRPAVIYGDFIDSVNFAAYNDIAGIIPCKFLRNNKIEEEKGFNKNRIQNLELQGDFLLFDDYTYSSVLSYINPIFDEYNKIDTRKSGKIKELLKVFNFNIESSGLHSVEENGKSGKRFIENHGSLTVFENGKIFYHYTSADANSIWDSNADGIHLSSFLGYDSSYYTFHERIKAASIFVNSLSSDIVGNDNDYLYLSDIKFEQNRLMIAFSYYYKGIKIKTDNQDTGVYIVISQNTIIEAGIDALNINVENTVRNPKQTAALSYFESELIKSKNIELIELPETEIQDIEDTEELIESDENIENIETEKFIINSLELIYNINTADIDKNIVASWIIK